MPRRELTHRPGELHPEEIERADDDTWTIPDVHLGRWTDRTRPAGSLTRDQLNSDTIAAAEYFRYRAPDDVSRLRVTLGDGPGARLEPTDALALATHALSAVGWLDDNVAPPGTRFVVEDALYLVEERAASSA